MVLYVYLYFLSAFLVILCHTVFWYFRKGEITVGDLLWAVFWGIFPPFSLVALIVHLIFEYSHIVVIKRNKGG